MAEKTDNKSENGKSRGQILDGFKYGFGFWLAGLAVWLLVSAVVAGLYYFI